MNFTSFTYLGFLLVVFLIGRVTPRKANYIPMLAASWAACIYVSLQSFMVLLMITAITYAAGRMVKPEKKYILAADIVLQLAVLFSLKYVTVFLRAAGYNTPDSVASKLIVPMGLSFYTLQSMGYVIDRYHGKIEAEKNFLRYALFVSFFPVITSGPIERASNLLPQIKEGPKERSFDNMRSGMLMILWGFFLKLIVADRLAIAVESVHGNLTRYHGILVVMAAVFYSFEIYCDFFGYSAIAIGSAKMLGYEVMQNFNTPYLSENISEFWRRWHISLSTWLRDYVYIPLGGNRRGTMRKYLNILIVFAISGIWHGTGLTFFIWGLLHGLYQVAGYLAQPVRAFLMKALRVNRDDKAHKICRIAITFALVTFAWIFFEAGSVSEALHIIRSMGIGGIWWLTAEKPFTFGMDGKNCIMMLMGLAVVFAYDLLRYNKISVRKVITGQRLWFRWPIYIFVIVLVVICGVWGPQYDAASFIYTNF